jgi:hypothetical protein
MSVNIEYVFTKSLDQSNEEKVDDKMGQTGVAKYDLSVDTMEIGLRDVLIQLAKGDVSRKVVFVLDELDKLDGDYDESRRNRNDIRLLNR